LEEGEGAEKISGVGKIGVTESAIEDKNFPFRNNCRLYNGKRNNVCSRG